MATAWQDRASVGALVAGTVAVGVLAVEGPPGSGYGWGSVVISAGIVAGLFLAMAHLVRAETVGRALAAAGVALLVVVMFAASLLGNWGSEPASTRALDTVSTLLAVAASGLVIAVALTTVRTARPPRSHAVR